MDFRKTAFVLLGILFVSSHVDAEIVSVSFQGNVMADFEGEIDIDGSLQPLATISAFASEDLSHTHSNLEWKWEGSPTYGELTGESSLGSEMSGGAMIGGVHHASSNLTFEFTVDTPSEVSFSGSLHIEGDSLEADTVGFSFVSESTTLFSDSNDGNGGLASGSFSYTKMIDPGTYTMKLDAELSELIEAPETADVGWVLEGFVISEVSAVPELNSAILVLLGFGLSAMSRRRLQV